MGEKLVIKGYYWTDTGMVRPHNEDQLCVVPSFEYTDRATEVVIETKKGILLAVADGMGGTNAGEVAAEIAIKTIKDSTDKIDAILLRPAEIGKGLESIIYKAHLNIKAALNEENAGMGTTLVLALISGNKVYVAWCGDSRVYKYSSKIMDRAHKYDLPHLRILTDDHSVVWQMVKKGKLDPNEAREHELSNVITQSLGDPKSDPKPESASYTIAAGDKILVCSDGLNSMLPDEFIEELLAHEEEIDAIGNSLIEAANAAGGHDNISVILAHIQSVPEVADVITKPVKERPEAITAKSDLGHTKKDYSADLNKWVLNDKVLYIIIFFAVVALAMLYFAQLKKGEIQDNGIQKETKDPTQLSDTNSTTPLKDTMRPNGANEEGQEIDSIKK